MTSIVLALSAVVFALAAIPYFEPQSKVRPAEGSWKDILINRKEKRNGMPRVFRETA